MNRLRHHLEGMELTPPLFPDLLDQTGQPYPRHVWSIETIHYRKPPIVRKTHGARVDEMRCLVVVWDRPDTYVERLPPWDVQIRHYYNHWIPDKKHGHRLDQRYSCTSRRFQLRSDAVAFTQRVRDRMQNVLAAKDAAENEEPVLLED